ncbi:MAG: hypothetical protein HS128_04600 [Ideonella sp.]|nr:hypothetical protein [Ideonella sp.]MCC7455477.1 hypothetical protein [Nitrospira sp.]
MWTLNGAMHALDRALDSTAATALALLTLLAVPLAATTGIGRTARAEAHPSAATSAVASSYRLRCWQQGRLLFEQELAAPPLDGTGHALKARGDDRSGRPVLVTETAHATCLAQHGARAD